MIYTTGTISVNGNTATGTGTNWTAAGTLIRNGCTVIVFSSPVQVFQITAITDGATLSVTPAASPALTGQQYAILLSDSLSVDGLAQDIAETFGMYQRNISGFGDVMNGSGDVTITVDGETITVPGQKSLAKKGANSDITSLTGLTTALSISQGGTGSKSPFGSVAGSFCQGNDTRLTTVDGKSGGTLTSGVVLVSTSAASPVFSLKDSKGQVNVNSNIDSTTSGNRRIYRVSGSDAKTFLEVDGAFRCRQGTAAVGANANNGFNLNWNSSNQVEVWIDSSNVGLINMTFVSDRLLKKEIEYVAETEAAREEVMKWKPATYKYIARGVITESDTKLGFIANDIVNASPECVTGEGLTEGFDLDNPAGAYNLDQMAMIAKLTLAIQAQQNQLDEMKVLIQQIASVSAN